jgi:hypothetical protein
MSPFVRRMPGQATHARVVVCMYRQGPCHERAFNAPRRVSIQISQFPYMDLVNSLLMGGTWTRVGPATRAGECYGFIRGPRRCCILCCKCATFERAHGLRAEFDVTFSNARPNGQRVESHKAIDPQGDA